MMTPAQKRQRDAHNRKRQQALDRVNHVGTHDADRDGSMIHNADGAGGSMIPEAGTGHGAVDSPGNTSDFSSFFGGNRHMPDRSIYAPVNTTTPKEGFADINKTLAKHGVYLATIAENCIFKERG